MFLCYSTCILGHRLERSQQGPAVYAIGLDVSRCRIWQSCGWHCLVPRYVRRNSASCCIPTCCHEAPVGAFGSVRASGGLRGGGTFGIVLRAECGVVKMISGITARSRPLSVLLCCLSLNVLVRRGLLRPTRIMFSSRRTHSTLICRYI